MDEKLVENRAIVDRLIEAYVTRAGSEDAGRIVCEFVDGFRTDEEAIVGLTLLTLTAAERAADYSTPVDIWDPERRIDVKKALRLGIQTRDTYRKLAEGLKEMEERDG